MCEIAARLGIFCRGFRRWPDAVFLRIWMRAMGQSTHLNRAQMERLADLWQQTEQLRLRIPIACDGRTGCGPCRGWDEFSDAELERFCADILGQNVVINESFESHESRTVQTPVARRAMLTSGSTALLRCISSRPR